MNAIKSVLIGVGFLVPAMLVAAALTLVLVAIDYGPDPGGQVGLTLWGSWCLFCGRYFKSGPLFRAGLVLFACAIGLFFFLE